jgi:hypothetical protein
VIELIEDFLTEYRHKEEIIKELLSRGITVNERTWRANKALHNERYYEGKTDKMLVHSNSKGYKLTIDENEIMEFENDLISRSRDMEEQVRKSRYARKHKKNMNIFSFIKIKKSNA